ncbi:MAG: hypothetical protein ACKO96_48860, partial [Flammeovirgaceae bacterium]
TKDGRLSAKGFVGTPDHLRQLQNKYASAMAKFGMVRGEAGSRTRHERPDKDKSRSHSIER